MSKEFTYACVTRDDYDRMYDLFSDSFGAGLKELDAYMTSSAPASVDELRKWEDGLSDLLGRGGGLGGIHDGVVYREVDGAKVRVDIVEPEGPGPHPVLVYFHGGGWTIGSSRMYRQLAWRFAENGFVVFNVDYRLAPETPFPGPYEDCEAAVRWAVDNAAEYGGDPTRIAVGGDSAGGNLAAAVAQSLADDPNGPDIAAALLIYGVYDMRPISDSFMIEAYLGSDPGALLEDPRVSPIVAASKLPPSFVMVGSKDYLADDASNMATALREAGVTHEHVVVPNMPHAFLNVELYPEARRTIDQMSTFLHEHLSPSRSATQ